MREKLFGFLERRHRDALRACRDLGIDDFTCAGAPGATRSVGWKSRPLEETVTSPNRPSWKCSVAVSVSGNVTSTPSTGSKVVPAGRGNDFVINLAAVGMGRCLANVIIDGRKSDFAELNFLRPADVAAVEMYPRHMSLPMQFVRNDDCGAVVIWTKWALSSS